MSQQRGSILLWSAESQSGRKRRDVIFLLSGKARENLGFMNSVLCDSATPKKAPSFGAQRQSRLWRQLTRAISHLLPPGLSRCVFWLVNLLAPEPLEKLET